MKQAVTVAPHRVEIQAASVPQLGVGEALVRLERVGICGSDLHLFHGKHPYASYPRVQGHEAAGVVVEKRDAGGAVEVGQRVAIEPLIACGDCYPCRAGRRNCCVRLRVLGAHVDGCFREYVALPVSMLYSVGDLSADEAALAEPTSIGVQAAHRGAITAGEQVVVIGAGPIGAAVSLAALDRGARVMVVDRLPTRLRLMERLGVERTTVAGEEDVEAAIAAWTGGEGPAVMVDAVGAPSVIRQCCALVASAGRVVIIGLSDQEVSLPVIDFTRKEMTILGSRNNAGRFAEAIDLVGRHRARLGAMITDRYPLDAMPEAIQYAADHPAEVEKVMIEIWDRQDSADSGEAGQ
ncbi:MAG TPA: zinc-binding alcohol dehydrogenase family protein [Thermomicrobiales bacterium]|jgi:L-gulonate 5-dehydrogenase|nr:zinc-binding alcohol dehydrogenase family protein [Thermomicrobiales bacterium]